MVRAHFEKKCATIKVHFVEGTILAIDLGTIYSFVAFRIYPAKDEKLKKANKRETIFVKVDENVSAPFFPSLSLCRPALWVERAMWVVYWYRITNIAFQRPYTSRIVHNTRGNPLKLDKTP